MMDHRLTISPAGDLVEFWSEPFAQGSDARYTVYDHTAGTWADASPIWLDRDSERGISPIWDGIGRLLLGHVKEHLVSVTKQVTAETPDGSLVSLTVSNVTEVASRDLVLTRRTLGTNLSIVDGDLVTSEDLWIPGNTISITAAVRNTGDFTVPSATVGFSFIPDGQAAIPITVVTLPQPLGARHQASTTVTWVVPSGLPRGQLVARVDPANLIQELDETSGDNQAILIRGGVDLAVAFKSRSQYPTYQALDGQ